MSDLLVKKIPHPIDDCVDLGFQVFQCILREKVYFGQKRERPDQL